MARIYSGVFFLSLSLFAQTAKPVKPPGTTGIDLSALDRSVSPCTDFYGFACGAWLKNNPVPPDRSRWGRFDDLAERNREVLHEILEAAKAGDAQRNPVEREIGDFYASCMDEPAIETKGTQPVLPLLKEIAAIPNKAGITAELVTLQRRNVDVFFAFGSEQDAKDATQMIAGLDQGGISLPDRDYYLKTDTKSVELQNKFVAHVQKMFELLGDAPPAAASK